MWTDTSGQAAIRPDAGFRRQHEQRQITRIDLWLRAAQSNDSILQTVQGACCGTRAFDAKTDRPVARTLQARSKVFTQFIFGRQRGDTGTGIMKSSKDYGRAGIGWNASLLPCLLLDRGRSSRRFRASRTARPLQWTGFRIGQTGNRTPRQRLGPAIRRNRGKRRHCT
jgi:hypothetical protein